MIKQIKDGKTLIAIVGSMEDAQWGNNFITDNELPVQIGILRTNKSTIQSHIHKIRNRQFKSISVEFHIVLRGKAIVTLYNYDKEVVDKITLCPNMFCALYNGGHSFAFIKDDSLMIEVKNGSYTTVEDDKVKF
jgi:hypothetical protein